MKQQYNIESVNLATHKSNMTYAMNNRLSPGLMLICHLHVIITAAVIVEQGLVRGEKTIFI